MRAVKILLLTASMLRVHRSVASVLPLHGGGECSPVASTQGDVQTAFQGLIAGPIAPEPVGRVIRC